eukprot:5770614-Pleurochrysis_carterae.AAC.2
MVARALAECIGEDEVFANAQTMVFSHCTVRTVAQRHCAHCRAEAFARRSRNWRFGRATGARFVQAPACQLPAAPPVALP